MALEQELADQLRTRIEQTQRAALFTQKALLHELLRNQLVIMQVLGAMNTSVFEKAPKPEVEKRQA